MRETDVLPNSCKGFIAENIVANQFVKNRFDVYFPKVDNKGIDLLVRSEQGKISYIQVKSSCNDNYQFVRDTVFRNERDYYVCYVRFIKILDEYEIYLIPASAWEGDEENKAFVKRPKKEGAASPPEHGINFSSKTKSIFQKYLFDEQINNLI